MTQTEYRNDLKEKLLDITENLNFDDLIFTTKDNIQIVPGDFRNSAEVLYQLFTKPEAKFDLENDYKTSIETIDLTLRDTNYKDVIYGFNKII